VNNKTNAKSHAHLQSAPTDTRAKIAKEYVFANTNNKTEKSTKTQYRLLQIAGIPLKRDI